MNEERERKNGTEPRVGAKVELPFRILNRVYRHAKVV
jgi:hypothetical protein